MKTQSEIAAEILNSAADAAVTLAQNAHGTENPTSEQIENAFALIIVEAMKDEETRRIVTSAVAIAAADEFTA